MSLLLFTWGAPLEAKFLSEHYTEQGGWHKLYTLLKLYGFAKMTKKRKDNGAQCTIHRSLLFTLVVCGSRCKESPKDLEYLQCLEDCEDLLR